MQQLGRLNFLLFALFAVLVFAGCGRSDSPDESSENTGDDASHSWREGTIELIFNGEDFKDDVRVYYSEADGLTMLSDNSDVKDSDGDGLIVAIFELNGKLQFDLVDNGTRYGGRITDWSKDGEVIEGRGQLTRENEFTKQDLSFRLLLDD